MGGVQAPPPCYITGTVDPVTCCRGLKLSRLSALAMDSVRPLVPLTAHMWLTLFPMTSSQFGESGRFPRLRNHNFFLTSKHIPEIGGEVSLPSPGENQREISREIGKEKKKPARERNRNGKSLGVSYGIGTAKKSVVKSRNRGSPSNSKVKGVSTQSLSIAPAQCYLV